MDIKFVLSIGFVGSDYSMVVNNTYHCFGFVSEDEAKDEAIKILKSLYNISMYKEDIKFEWDGTL